MAPRPIHGAVAAGLRFTLLIALIALAAALIAVHERPQAQHAAGPVPVALR